MVSLSLFQIAYSAVISITASLSLKMYLLPQVWFPPPESGFCFRQDLHDPYNGC